MKSYRVRWEIDIEADSPEEAAARALIIQRDRDGANAATVFDVILTGDEAEYSWRRVDLGEITAEQAEEKVRQGCECVGEHAKDCPNLSPLCEACGGQHWLIFTVSGSERFPNGSVVVQKCDQCEVITDDDDAVGAALRVGLDCSLEGLVPPREVDRWMALYPNRGIMPRN